MQQQQQQIRPLQPLRPRRTLPRRTNEDELEEQSDADAVDEEGEKEKRKVRFARAASNARYSAEPRRRTMPGSQPYTWGRHKQWADEELRAERVHTAVYDRMTTGAGASAGRLVRSRTVCTLVGSACGRARGSRLCRHLACLEPGWGGSGWRFPIASRLVPTLCRDVGGPRSGGRGLSQEGAAVAGAPRGPMLSVRRWYGAFVRI
jgi:hypothetical protein